MELFVENNVIYDRVIVYLSTSEFLPSAVEVFLPVACVCVCGANNRDVLCFDEYSNDDQAPLPLTCLGERWSPPPPNLNSP